MVEVVEEMLRLNVGHLGPGELKLVEGHVGLLEVPEEGGAGVQVCRCTGAGVQACMCAGVQVSRCAGVQVCRCAGVQVLEAPEEAQLLGAEDHEGVPLPALAPRRPPHPAQDD